MLLPLFLPLYVGEVFGEMHHVLPACFTDVGCAMPKVYIWVCSALSTVVSLLALGFYTRRRVQLRLCGVIFLLVTATFLLIVYYVRLKVPNVSVQYDLGTYAVVAGMVCNWLARLFIRRDEERVQNANRLL